MAYLKEMLDSFEKKYAATNTQSKSLMEDFWDDDLDDYELSNLYGGDMTDCPMCGSRLEYDEDGDHYCPQCNMSAYSLAQERRDQDKSGLNEASAVPHIELSTKAGSISDLILQKKEAIDNSANMQELIQNVKTALQGSKSQKAAQILTNLAKMTNVARGITYLYNVILKGDNAGVIPDASPRKRKYEAVSDVSEIKDISQRVNNEPHKIKEDAESTLGTQPTQTQKYQDWVDYDVSHYGKISKRTQHFLKQAGLKLQKDDDGKYVVTGDISAGRLSEETSKEQRVSRRLR